MFLTAEILMNEFKKRKTIELKTIELNITFDR